MFVQGTRHLDDYHHVVDGTTYPSVLRTSAAAGHGAGATLAEMIEQDVDVYAFLFAKLR